jgi:cation transport protein ChaC
MSEGGERWVFGYGSLMWRPGFDFLERQPARLHGRRRAFCIYSVHHRGTYARPGLVLGLAPGGAVRGAAYRIAPAAWDAVYAYLRERDVKHPQWAGALSLEAQARLIAGAAGLSGRNIDYLRDLVMHLHEEGVADSTMERLLRRVEALEAEAA